MNLKLNSGELKIFLLLLSFSISLQSFAQHKAANFYDIQKKFYERHSAAENRAPYEKKFHDDEYDRFKRLEWFMAPRVYPTGNFNAGILWDEWTKHKAKRLQDNPERSLVSNWTPIGPPTPPANGGAGRVNCIEVASGNPNLIYIGAANGGLWKSTNGGASWSTATDNIPTLSIADIAINPQNNNIVYIATGDGYGYVAYGDFWGGTYSAGILKSTDGGATWNATGFTFAQSDNRIINRLIINPNNPQILFAATDNGLWRTTDGGTTWSAVISPDRVYDVEFKPSNPSRIYAAAEYGVIYYSSNDGSNWNVATQFSSTGRTSLAVTPADSNYVYAWTQDFSYSLFKSVDGGISFNPVTSPWFEASPYGYYDMVLGVSPTDANTVYAGGFALAQSTDGGNSWIVAGDWQFIGSPNYLHADQHDVAFVAGNGNTVFASNDGGIFKSTDAGWTWTDISNGLCIAQYYRLGCSASDASIIYAGQQDQGTAQRIGSSWNMVSFGDGMETIVDPTNPNNVYHSLQYGDLYFSWDGGQTSLDITPLVGSGGWTTPYEMHPSNPSLLFGAWDEVLESNDGGMSWFPLTSFLSGGDTYTVFASAPSNSNTLYAGTNTELFCTTNGGSSWNNISAGLPFANNVPSYIAVSGTDPQKLWITFIGYESGNKVFKSINGGTTWTNVSGTLPNVPVNCIVYQNGSPDALYIGTDFGVFYRDNTMNDWAPFDTGLPHCIVNELEIHYGSYKLRAATYGRGLWESDLGFGVGVPETAQQTALSVYPNPSHGNFTVTANSVGASQLTISNQLGEKIYERQISAPKTEINLSSCPAGIYFLQIKEGSEMHTEKLIISR